MNNLGASLFELQYKDTLAKRKAREDQDWAREQFYAKLDLDRMDRERAAEQEKFKRELDMAKLYGEIAGVRGLQPRRLQTPEANEIARVYSEYVPVQIEKMRAQSEANNWWRPLGWDARMQQIKHQQDNANAREQMKGGIKMQIDANLNDYRNRYLQLQYRKLALEEKKASPEYLRQKQAIEGEENELAKAYLRAASIQADMAGSLNATDPMANEDMANTLLMRGLGLYGAPPLSPAAPATSADPRRDGFTRGGTP